MSDAFETYLKDATTSSLFAISSFDADSDMDGMPDGIEFALTGGKAVNTPGYVPALGPAVAIGSHQTSNDKVVFYLFLIPGDWTVFDEFRFVMAVPTKTGPELFDFTQNLPSLVEAVRFVTFNGVMMAVYQLTLPTSLIREYGSITVGAAGELGGVAYGDQAVFTIHGQTAYRWVYSPIPNQPPGSTTVMQAEAQPQKPAPVGSTPSQVCGAVDSMQQTEVPGLLHSVVLSIGCTTGTWACDAGVCHEGGDAAKPKAVLAVKSLLGL